MRWLMMGMYDNQATSGPITGSGPGFATAMAKFAKRQDTERRTGIWRKAPSVWKVDDGPRVDTDWMILDQGQDG